MTFENVSEFTSFLAVQQELFFEHVPECLSTVIRVRRLFAHFECLSRVIRVCLSTVIRPPPYPYMN